MQNKLIQYVRNDSNQPIGVVVAKQVAPNYVCVGWSKCNPKDNFNKKRALAIAEGRCMVGTNKLAPVELHYALTRIVSRAKDYFVGCQVKNCNRH